MKGILKFKLLKLKAIALICAAALISSPLQAEEFEVVIDNVYSIGTNDTSGLTKTGDPSLRFAATASGLLILANSPQLYNFTQFKLAEFRFVFPEKVSDRTNEQDICSRRLEAAQGIANSAPYTAQLLLNFEGSRMTQIESGTPVYRVDKIISCLDTRAKVKGVRREVKRAK